MKHLLILLTAMSITICSLAQSKKNETKTITVQHQYFLMLSDTTAQTISALVKTSRKLSEDDKDSFLKLLNENIHPVTIPDTAATKRK